MEYFNRSLVLINELVNVYSKLDGCLLIEKLNISIFINRGMKSRLKINNETPIHTAELNLEECLNELLVFLKFVQQKWLNYANELRNQFENLNYFTNKQLKLIMNNLRVDKNNQLIIDDFQLVNSIIFNLNSSLILIKE